MKKGCSYAPCHSCAGELHVRHSPRLAFQSQFEDSGKTTAMTLLMYVSARAMATSSLTGASLFRETDAHHWTVLWDEADNAFHKNTNPELIGVFNAGHDRKFSIVHRQVPSPDGGYVTCTFDTFHRHFVDGDQRVPVEGGAEPLHCSGHETAPKTMLRSLRSLTDGHEAALTECGRKLVRWAADIDALPKVNKKDTGLIPTAFG